MALKNSAKWVRGISRVRFIPRNADMSEPSATGGVIGGTGPFDFTPAHSVIAAVPISLKVDAGTVVNDTLDLSGSTENAVTAAEWVAAFTASTIAGFTASVNADGRVKVVSGSGAILQVYGQAAELAGIGQGIGCKYIKSNTIETVSIDPVVKADTTHTVTPADGIDVEVVDEGYKKGVSGQVVDTSQDYEMMRLFEGGVIDSAGAYTDPDENSQKVYFMMEVYNPVYGQGSQKIGEFTGYEKTLVKSAVGAVGGENFSADFRKKTYTYTATNFKTAAGVVEGAVKRSPLTIAAFNALNLDNI
jgi:hypothetical protein